MNSRPVELLGEMPITGLSLSVEGVSKKAGTSEKVSDSYLLTKVSAPLCYSEN